VGVNFSQNATVKYATTMKTDRKSNFYSLIQNYSQILRKLEAYIFRRRPVWSLLFISPSN
jgi:hypothetical protein